MGTLSGTQREIAASEINRFLRTMGRDTVVAQLTKLEVERYQQRLVDSGVEVASRIEPLKAFLVHLKTKKLTDVNLGAGLRVKRRSGSIHGQREAAAVFEVTREGFEQLQAEMQRLETEELPSVREELTAAYQDRDFRENAPYDAAKRRMGEIQGRINELRAQLSKSRIVEISVSTERVGLGSRVVLRDLEYKEELPYTLVGPGEVDTRKGRISINSPVGTAIKDRTVGDTVEVDIPTGKARYRIERIEKPD